MLHATLSDGRIVITGDTFGHQSFLRSLPDSRWNPVAKSWTCLATPFAALKLIERFEVSPEVFDLCRYTASEDTALVGSKTTAWRHQWLALRHAISLRTPHLGLAMGTGKSKVCTDWIAAAGHSGHRTLILCPLSVVNVWPNQFATHREEPWTVLALNKGSTAQKAGRIRHALQSAKAADNVAVVVNYDSARFGDLAKLLLSLSWTEVVLDESHRAKGPASDTGRFCFKVGHRAERRMCLTGTPMPHSPLDIYSQYRFLDAAIFGTNYREFRDRYAVCDRQFPSRVLSWKNMDEFESKLRLLMFRCGQDVLDLPPITHNVRTATLPPVARRIYDQLEEDLCAEVKDGVITVANALVKLLRLQQITSGYVLADDETVERELHEEKRRLLADILEDLPDREPVVVFARFRRDLDAIAYVAQKLGRRYGELSGRSKDGLTDRATMSEEVDVLGCQMQSGGVGVDLTRASVAVYYSVGYSLGDYEQSLARAHRPGQDRPVRVYHLVCEDTVDREVYTALDKKQQVVEAILQTMKGAKDVELTGSA